MNDPCIAAAEVSGECVGKPLEGFVKNLSSLSEQEKTALLADLAEIEKYENQINEIYSRMTDENEKRLCDEIDTLDEKLTAVLERNSELWERVNDEYDEKIAANEPDMTLELNEADFDDICPAEGSYEEFIKGVSSLSEQEKSALRMISYRRHSAVLRYTARDISKIPVQRSSLMLKQIRTLPLLFRRRAPSCISSIPVTRRATRYII